MHLKNNGGVYTNAILICCRENFNEQKFITSGYRQIIIWKIKGNVIKKYLSFN